jgi:hypothetical protein
VAAVADDDDDEMSIILSIAVCFSKAQVSINLTSPESKYQTIYLSTAEVVHVSACTM